MSKKTATLISLIVSIIVCTTEHLVERNILPRVAAAAQR